MFDVETIQNHKDMPKWRTCTRCLTMVPVKKDDKGRAHCPIFKKPM